MRRIEEACYWMTTRPFTCEPPLEESIRSDLVIIGGGFTGLWCSLFLKEMDPSCEVVLLEKEMVGYGGTGRNGGILGDTIDHSHDLAIAHFGFEEAQKLASLGKSNVEEMIAFFEEQQIDCEMERTGRLFVSLNETQLSEIKKAIQSAIQLNVSGLRLLNQEEIRRELNSPLYIGGLIASGGGILNPFALAQGLKKLALQKGVRIHERTPAVAFHDATVQCAKGAVTGKKMILATDAYTHHLFPKLLKHFIPLYDYILVSEPLDADRLSRIGWRNRQGVVDCRTFFNYYRLTKENRILWGTSEAKYYPPNRVDEACDHSEAHYRALRESFQRHFPQLGVLQFDYKWGGPIASTTRLTPFFGTMNKGRIFYALGYTGHGIGSTRIAGRILAHMALNRPTELLDLKLVRNKPFPYPPEPFRKIAVNAVTNALRKTDAGKNPSLLLRVLNLLGIGFSS